MATLKLTLTLPDGRYVSAEATAEDSNAFVPLHWGGETSLLRKVPEKGPMSWLRVYFENEAARLGGEVEEVFAGDLEAPDDLAGA